MPPPKESESDPAEVKSFQLNLVNLKWYHCAHRSISCPPPLSKPNLAKPGEAQLESSEIAIGNMT